MFNCFLTTDIINSSPVQIFGGPTLRNYLGPYTRIRPEYGLFHIIIIKILRYKYISKWCSINVFK